MLRLPQHISFSFHYRARQGLSKPFPPQGVPMRILISNDDGIYSSNLHMLHAALVRAGHNVRAVAPAEQHSGAGCCLTVHGPILTRKVSLPHAEGGAFEGIAVSGTPADCVILALRGIMPDFKPDLVISGINFGPNAGQDVFFSGTVGAAIQAAMYGLPSMAVSHCAHSGLTMAHAELVVRMAEAMDWAALPVHRVYNFNLPDCPAEEIRGLKVCPHSTDWACLDSYERRYSPRGREYYWMIDPFQHFQLEDEGTDKTWLHRGWATLTPLNIDLNDRETAKKLNENRLWDSIVS